MLSSGWKAGFTDDIEETGTTLEENAAIKARYLHNKTGQAVLAEDPDFVDALNGAPGIWLSACYAGSHGNDKANLQLVLQNMEGQTNRTAHFAACLCFIDHHGTSHFSKAVCTVPSPTNPYRTKWFWLTTLSSSPMAKRSLMPNWTRKAVKNSMSHRAKPLPGGWDI